MALDESSTDKDTKIVKEELEFVIDNDLTKLVGGVFIDFSEHGFHIKSEKELPNSGGCSSACSSCS